MNSMDLLIGCFVIYVLCCFVVVWALCKRIQKVSASFEASIRAQQTMVSNP
jgi:CHASE3 domain sensor protein